MSMIRNFETKYFNECSKLDPHNKKASKSAWIHTENPFERSLTGLIRSWLAYAEDHTSRYEDLISEDFVLGPVWLEMGRNILALLNGETGRLDCGAIHRAVAWSMEQQGFNPDKD